MIPMHIWHGLEFTISPLLLILTTIISAPLVILLGTPPSAFISA